MPNNPLSTFRAVEPPFAGFSAAAGLASVPFVLHHVRTEVAYTPSGGAAGSGTAVTAWANISSTSFPNVGKTATRFMPWVNRLDSAVYPVAIPNAYDRVYIFPVFMLDRTPLHAVSTSTADGVTTTTITDTFATNLPVISSPISYLAPSIIPYGLFPETRNAGSGGTMTKSRLPDDLIRAASGVAVPLSGVKENGLWGVLPPYASNFTTLNTLSVAGTAAAPTSGGRYVVSRTASSETNVLGNGYALPSDFSISNSTTSNLAVTAGASGAAPAASGTTASDATYVTGAGLEFSLQGCTELVVAHAVDHSGLAFTANAAGIPLLAGTAAGPPATNGNVEGTYYPKVAANYFLMGVFLG